jgi:hypothetical protein
MVIEVVASDLENDRDRRGCRLGRQRSGIPDGDEQGDRPPSQFGGQPRQPIHLTIGPSINDRHVPRQIRFPSRLGEMRVEVGRRAVEEPDHRHPRLLPARGQRPGRRAAEQRDELATFHSITSSASKL